jgi:hypothetical protein
MSLAVVDRLQHLRTTIYELNDNLLKGRERVYQERQKEEPDIGFVLDMECDSFASIIELFICNIAAAREENHFSAAFQGIQSSEDSSPHDKAEALLSLCENMLSTKEYSLLVENIYQYMHETATVLMDICLNEITRIRNGRVDVQQLNENELKCVLELQNFILNLGQFPYKTQEQQVFIEEQTTELRHAQAFAPLEDTKELDLVCQAVREYRVHSVGPILSLDRYLQVTKEWLCQFESYKTSPMLRYFALTKFLRTVISSHLFMIRRQKRESLNRCEEAGIIIRHLYAKLEVACEASLQKRVEKLILAKKEEILKTSDSLTRDPFLEAKEEEEDPAEYQLYHVFNEGIQGLELVLGRDAEEKEMEKVVIDVLSALTGDCSALEDNDPVQIAVNKLVKVIQAREFVDRDFAKYVMDCLIKQRVELERIYLPRALDFD